jgi:hypothetical protein
MSVPETPPVLELTPKLYALFSRHGESALTKAKQVLTKARRCIYVTAERVSTAPLRRGSIGRLLGLRVAPPLLLATDSKWGGTPFIPRNDIERVEGCRFIGQINLAELPEGGVGVPPKGILALDFPNSGAIAAVQTRFYAEPHVAENHPVTIPSLGTYEAKLNFRLGWSLPQGEDWWAVIPEGDDDLWNAWNDWEPAGYEDESCHRIGGHRSGGLDEHYGFTPPVGRSSDIREYEMLLRLNFDNAAGFAWGTNWIYVIIHRDDLAAGRLDRAVVTGANS